ncbi:hypothetical protein A8C56_22195 [Niabella ginsenosidivorans]|uniref:Uncharacterized protein n=1 Tax=Niabella ginsenosidivorans TaxID=1176587 RepID=A0A1A9I9E7_9BACT|nr:hypothetical protein A8C56_22195 [Niabella ginsenosidivorans]
MRKKPKPVQQKAKPAHLKARLTGRAGFACEAFFIPRGTLYPSVAKVKGWPPPPVQVGCRGKKLQQFRFLLRARR